METDVNAVREIEELLDELEGLLKDSSFGASLTARGINTSLALVIAQGLRAYIQGNKKQASDDLGTAAEEIGARLGLGDQPLFGTGEGPKSGPPH